MMQGEHIPQDDLILYAMQALSAEEHAAVGLHLEDCEQCRGELAVVNGDLALVAMSVEQKPLPEGARQRFIDRISGAPVVSPKDDAAPVTAIDSKRRGRRVSVWIPWMATAALLFLTIMLWMRVRSLNDELGRQYRMVAQMAEQSSHAQQVLDVLNAPASKRVLLVGGKAKPEPTGHAVYLAENGGLIFQGNDLAALPENKTYELWVIPANGQAPIPAGLFRPDAAGSASLVLPPLPKGVEAKAFGVTIEKAEGSLTPTAPIVLAGAVPTSGE